MSADEKQFLIEKLSNFIDQQARRKFLQQIQYQSNLQQYQQEQPQELNGPGFSFELPPQLIKGSNENEEIQFAVPPFDSRYYEQIPLLEDVDDDIALGLDDEVPVEREVVTTAKSNTVVVVGETKNKILIPSPMHVLDSQSNDLNSRILHRAQQKQQQIQLQKNQRQENDVLQKPMQIDNTTSLYIVALIAGLSCAFSTGVTIHLFLSYCTSFNYLFNYLS